jgi:hypothetical protein
VNAVSAEVQVLTAEVRVLMVGSRQVTLSVFRQLDWVDDDALAPFGRVHDDATLNADSKKLGLPPDTLQVVGVGLGDTDNAGALVRSSVRLYPGQKNERYREWDELPLIVLAGLK